MLYVESVIKTINETGAVLVAKTIDLRSGRRLATIQISAGEEAQSPVPKDFRDAPGDIKRSACAVRRNGNHPVKGLTPGGLNENYDS